MPEETFEPPPDEADELLGVELVELPGPDPALRWACAACSANRPKLAAPAVCGLSQLAEIAT